jgi:hypothetical protein
MGKTTVGRPTTMTKDTLAKLEYAFSIGCSDSEACLHANINKSTLYRFQNENPEFKDRKDLLKEKLVLVARTNIAYKLNEKDTATSIWYLERKKKAEFSTRLEATGADGKDLLPTIIHDDIK